MEPETHIIELIAAEAAGELDRAGLDRLGEICQKDEAAHRLREHFRALIDAGADDDTKDAPASTLYRAYRIMKDAGHAPNASAEAARPSILKIIYDSLRPVAGLRSAGTARRQLMLEFEDLSIDVFVDSAALGCTVTLMVEGTEPESAALVSGDGDEHPMQSGGGEWKAQLTAGTYALRIVAGNRTLESEPFEIV